jgi:RimJ/RimL family protein N-acetyltransferase
MSEPRLARSKIELHPWDETDWPIAWLWMQPYWRQLVDDSIPRDLDFFVENQRMKGAVSFGVYRDDELGGLLTQVTVSPWKCFGDCVFKKSFWGRDTTVPALEAGKRLAWSMGYHKISCIVFEDNHLMIGLLNRVGGIFEGILLEDTQREGRKVNMLSYALLRDAED